MLRLALVVVLLAVPATARADCAASCDSVCYAGTSALFLAEVIDAEDGIVHRVRLTERLGGSPTILADVGDEYEDVYAETVVATGDELVLSITEEDRVFNTAWRVEDDTVECSSQQRVVALDDYIAMATSADCEQVAEDLDLVSRCDDTVGCSSGGGASLSLFAMLAAIGLVVRRRRRAA